MIACVSCGGAMLLLLLLSLLSVVELLSLCVRVGATCLAVRMT